MVSNQEYDHRLVRQYTDTEETVPCTWLRTGTTGGGGIVSLGGRGAANSRSIAAAFLGGGAGGGGMFSGGRISPCARSPKVGFKMEDS